MTEQIKTNDLDAELKSTRKRRTPMWLKLIKWFVLPVVVTMLLFWYFKPTPEARMQSYYEKGMAFLAEEAFDKANIEFRNALQIKKNMTPAVYGMAQVAEKKGDLRSAYQHYLTVAEQDNKHVMARVKLANIYLSAGQPEKAADYIAQLQKLAPDDEHVLLVQAFASLRAGDDEQAVALAKQAMAKSPKFNESYALLASERMKHEDADQALAFLEQGLKQIPNDKDLSFYKINILESRKQLDEATRVFEQLIKQEPTKNKLRIEFVRFYIRNQQFAQAEAQLRELIKLDSKDHDAKLALLEVLGRAKGKEAASLQLDAFVKETPEDMKLRFAQYGAAMQKKDNVAAKKILQLVIDEASEKQDRLKAKGLLAQMYLAEKNRKAADALITEVLKEDARDQQSLMLQAGLDIEAGAFESAITRLTTVTVDNPKAVGALIELAQTYAKTGQYAQANQAYQKAIDADQGDTRGLMAYAAFEVSRGELEQAEKALNDVLARVPDSLPALQMLVNVQTGRSNWQGAVATVEALRKVAKSPHLADFLLSNVYFAQKNYAASVPLIQRVYEAEPKNGQVFALLITQLVVSGKSADAVSLLNRLHDENPQDAVPQLMLAQVYLQTKQVDKAKQVYESMIAQPAQVVSAYQELAKLYLLTGKLDKAQPVIEAGLKQYPNDMTLQFLQADLLTAKGEFMAAKLVYEAMLKLDGNDISVLNNLAVLLVEHSTDQESINRAYQMTQKFAKREEPGLRDTVGWVAYKAGKYVEAVKALEFVVAKSPANPVFQYHLGKAYLATLDNVRAKQALHKALEGAAGHQDVPVNEIKDLIATLG